MKTPQQLLQQTLEVGECLLPDASPGGRTPYPTVFVHGLLGWGARDALYRALLGARGGRCTGLSQRLRV